MAVMRIQLSLKIELGCLLAKMLVNTFMGLLSDRILGTNETPFFYAADIGKALGIKKISKTIEGFGELDIVSPAVRKEYGLVTYKRYNDTFRINNQMTLLTEMGVYHVIFVSRSPIAKEFRIFVSTVIRDRRRGEIDQLKIASAMATAELEERNAAVVELKAQNATLADMLARAVRGTEYVYFIKAVGSCEFDTSLIYVKIGRSKHPERRRDHLQTGCPLNLAIVDTIECDAVKVERKLHKRHADRRGVGEWFTFTRCDLEFAIADAIRRYSNV